MRFTAICNQCLQDSDFTFTFIFLEFQHDAIYKMICPRDHETIVTLQEELFQILFDHGALALTDGYPREAVSSFASSLERFYEFSIKILLVEQGVSIQEINQTWKLVASQSERQLGAFFFLYLNVFKKAPEPIDPKWIKFRNDVIHKGHIPTQEKVHEYASYIYDYMVKFLSVMKQDYFDSFITVFTEKQKNPLVQEGIRRGIINVVVMAPIIDIMADNFEMRSFNDALQSLLKRKDGIYSK